MLTKNNNSVIKPIAPDLGIFDQLFREVYYIEENNK